MVSCKRERIERIERQSTSSQNRRRPDARELGRIFLNLLQLKKKKHSRPQRRPQGRPPRRPRHGPGRLARLPLPRPRRRPGGGLGGREARAGPLEGDAGARGGRRGPARRREPARGRREGRPRRRRVGSSSSSSSSSSSRISSPCCCWLCDNGGVLLLCRVAARRPVSRRRPSAGRRPGPRDLGRVGALGGEAEDRFFFFLLFFFFVSFSFLSLRGDWLRRRRGGPRGGGRFRDGGEVSGDGRTTAAVEAEAAATGTKRVRKEKKNTEKM